MDPQEYSSLSYQDRSSGRDPDNPSLQPSFLQRSDPPEDGSPYFAMANARRVSQDPPPTRKRRKSSLASYERSGLVSTARSQQNKMLGMDLGGTTRATYSTTSSLTYDSSFPTALALSYATPVDQSGISAIYGGKAGFLFVSSKYLCFASSDSTLVPKWAWNTLDKVTAFTTDDFKEMIRIKQDKSDQEPLFFQVENYEILTSTKHDFRARIRAAKMITNSVPEESIIPRDSIPESMDQRSALHEQQQFTNLPLSQSQSNISLPTHYPQSRSDKFRTSSTKSKSSRSKSTSSKPLSVTEADLEVLVNDMVQESLSNHLPQQRSDLQSKEIVALIHSVIDEREQEKAKSASSALRQPNVQSPFSSLLEKANQVVPHNHPSVLAKPEDLHSPFGDLDPAHRSWEEKTFLLDGAQREGEDESRVAFGESVYTLLYLYPVKSQAFLYGILVYIIQITTIALTIADIVNTDTPHNVLQLPPMVSATVTCAQAIAIFMLVAYTSDLIEAVMKLQDGYYPEMELKFRGASFSTWGFSIMAQMIAGLLLLSASFILTMQVDSVIDVMLNLTALMFMAEIDDLGFAIAKMGFITDRLQKQTKDVVGVHIPTRSRTLERRLLYLLSLIGLFTGYAILKHMQLDGQYLPSYIYIQFGDSYNQKIPYYSGIMSYGGALTTGYRQYRDVGTEEILLSYCRAEKAWTFSYGEDPCDYFAISSETTTYDVTSTSDDQWQVKDSMGRLQPFDTMSLVSRDCDPDSCQGDCLDGLCQCPHDQFGMDCEFSNVCGELVIDGRAEPFPLATIHRWPLSDEFHLLKNDYTGKYVKVYNLPVYYSNRTFPANIIFYGGRRWILTSERDLFDLAKAQEENPVEHFFPELTVATLENGFHAYDKANYTPFLLSDPVDFETPDFLPTPAGLGWWTVMIENATSRQYAPDSPLNSVLTCKACHSNQGGFCDSVGGTCNDATGLCECNDGYYGHKCELQQACYDMFNPCNGRGTCDDTSGVCRCNTPYYGKGCEMRYKCFEENGSCRNGGVCNLTQGFCDCPDPATSGEECELNDDCRIYGCSHGGICALNNECLCRPPYYGILCDLVNTTQKELLCQVDSDCSNGSCNVATGLCNCEDSSLFGTLCEHEFSCTWGGCLNSGRCNEATGVCSCPEPFFGPDCSEELRCFDDKHCQEFYDDGSVCNSETGRCHCSLWNSGKSCFSMGALLCESDDDCNGHGVCRESGHCQCTYPHAGVHCDKILDDYESEYANFLFVGKCVEMFGFPPYLNDTDNLDCTLITSASGS